MIRELRRKKRTLDDRILRVVDTIGGFRMRHVGNAQQQLVQLALLAIQLVGQHLLLFAQRAALSLQRLRARSVAVAAFRCHLLRYLVDLSTKRVAARLHRTHLSIEFCGTVQLRQHFRSVPPGQPASNSIEISAQESDVDHVVTVPEPFASRPSAQSAWSEPDALYVKRWGARR